MINIQNIDNNECFRWCLVRYLYHADHHPARITNPDKNFAKERSFKDIKFPGQNYRYSQNPKKDLSPLAFLVIKYPNFVSKKDMLNYY